MPPEKAKIDQINTTEVVKKTADFSGIAKEVNTEKTKITLLSEFKSFKDLFNGLKEVKNDKNIKEKSSAYMGKIGNIMHIDIPFLGKIWSLFGTKWPIDLLWTKEQRKNKKRLNRILWFLGVQGWLEGLHEWYVEEQLKWVDKKFAKDCYQEYKKNEKTDILDDQKTRNKCGLDVFSKNMKPEDKTALQNKIPQDFEGLKNSVIKEFQDPNNIAKLNISTVNMVGEPFIGTNADGQKIVNIEEIKKNINGFTDTYLKLTIPQLVNPENDFIKSQSVNADTFAYALFGNLTGEKFFVEGVNLGLLKPIEDINNKNIANIEKKNLKELNFEEAKILANKIFGDGPATNLLFAMSNNTPAMILRSIALAKHEGGLKFWLKNTDPNKKSAQINIWTFQISAKKNEIVNKRNKNLEEGLLLLKEHNISYEEAYFKKLNNYNDETWDSTQQKAQTDLLVWLWFIQKERGGKATLEKLADNTLSDNEIVDLMSSKIQWGIGAIGKDIVAQIKNWNTDQYAQLA